MKKSLLALAILGSFAGVASAQTSNVTVYGIMDLSLSHYNGNGPYGKGSWTGIEEGNDGNAHNGSRIGFKGTEDLGGGLSAIFKMEGGFAADTGKSTQNGTLFGRQSWVGLSSKSAGTVTFGRQDSLIFDGLDVVDPFDEGFVGNILGGLAGGFGFGGQSRVNNSVVYHTPDFAGFSAAAQYGFGEQANKFGAGAYTSFAANYANGPIAVTADFGKTKDATTGINTKSYLLGGTYDLQVVKLAAAYGSTKTDDDITNKRNYMLGATVPVGAFSVFGSWVRTDDRSAANLDADQFAIGAQYNLSKRTNLYTAVGYGKIHNTTGANTTGFQVGIDHAF